MRLPLAPVLRNMDEPCRAAGQLAIDDVVEASLGARARRTCPWLADTRRSTPERPRSDVDGRFHTHAATTSMNAACRKRCHLIPARLVRGELCVVAVLSGKSRPLLLFTLFMRASWWADKGAHAERLARHARRGAYCINHAHRMALRTPEGTGGASSSGGATRPSPPRQDNFV